MTCPSSLSLFPSASERETERSHFPSLKNINDRPDVDQSYESVVIVIVVAAAATNNKKKTLEELLDYLTAHRVLHLILHTCFNIQSENQGMVIVKAFISG